MAGRGAKRATGTPKDVIAKLNSAAVTALADPTVRLVAIASGEGVLTTIWHTYGIIEQPQRSRRNSRTNIRTRGPGPHPV
jgi:hypothetical protein